MLNVLTHILSECHGKRYYSDHVAVVQQNVSHVVIETIFSLLLKKFDGIVQISQGSVVTLMR